MTEAQPKEVPVTDTKIDLLLPVATANGAAAAGPVDDVITIRRRKFDSLLIVAGVVVAAVLVVAGALLTWGSNFADDYVEDELTAQNIFFPDQASLEEQGRTDLVEYSEEQVTTGSEAEAYASYIDGHLADIADGATYAELGGPEREAKAAVTEAQENGADEATITELQMTADEVTAQRDSLFRGETLRGLLLSTFAWSTIGRIAGIAAVVAFVAAGVMLVLVALGLIHRQRTA
jgi:hypothetical protein